MKVWISLFLYIALSWSRLAPAGDEMNNGAEEAIPRLMFVTREHDGERLRLIEENREQDIPSRGSLGNIGHYDFIGPSKIVASVRIGNRLDILGIDLEDQRTFSLNPSHFPFMDGELTFLRFVTSFARHYWLFCDGRYASVYYADGLNQLNLLTTHLTAQAITAANFYSDRTTLMVILKLSDGKSDLLKVGRGHNSSIVWQHRIDESSKFIAANSRSGVYAINSPGFVRLHSLTDTSEILRTAGAAIGFIRSSSGESLLLSRGSRLVSFDWRSNNTSILPIGSEGSILISPSRSLVYQLNFVNSRNELSWVNLPTGVVGHRELPFTAKPTSSRLVEYLTLYDESDGSLYGLDPSDESLISLDTGPVDSFRLGAYFRVGDR